MASTPLLAPLNNSCFSNLFWIWFSFNLSQSSGQFSISSCMMKPCGRKVVYSGSFAFSCVMNISIGLWGIMIFLTRLGAVFFLSGDLGIRATTWLCHTFFSNSSLFSNLFWPFISPNIWLRPRYFHLKITSAFLIFSQFHCRLIKLSLPVSSLDPLAWWSPVGETSCIPALLLFLRDEYMCCTVRKYYLSSALRCSYVFFLSADLWIWLTTLTMSLFLLYLQPFL